jgi:hypothetical protein
MFLVHEAALDILFALDRDEFRAPYHFFFFGVVKVMVPNASSPSNPGSVRQQL